VPSTLQELEAGYGQAVTATGTLLPIPTVIKLASHAYHYLSVFDKHTGRALHLARTRRIASADQRIVLLARDRRWTRPGCTVPRAYWQVHPAVGDWAQDGQTNVDDLTLACPRDNLSVKPGGWKTRNAKTAAPNGSHHHTSTGGNQGQRLPSPRERPTTRRRRRVITNLLRGDRAIPAATHRGCGETAC